MKKSKKILAVILALIMAGSCFATTSFASDVKLSQNGQKIVYTALDKMVTFAVSVLNKFIPGIDDRWQNLSDFKPSYDFYPGKETFDENVEPGAKWSAGYASASLLDGLEKKNGVYLYKGKKVYMAGTLEPIKGRQPTEIVDDQQVCTYALSDGTSGTVVHAVIDGYGIASSDVLKIRNRLAVFAKEHNIISINVSVLHQHSCIDILGMGAPLLQALVVNPFLSVVGENTDKFVGGKTPEFMENLYRTVAKTITDAVENMDEGTLYYGSADISEYIRDKRDPQVIDPEAHRFRFVPNNKEENEIWICQAGLHATGAGISTTKICGDYPYYLRQDIKETTGADVVFVQGAELAITANYDNVSYDDSVYASNVKAMGKALAAKIKEIKNDVALAPILNIAIRNVNVKATNQILELAVREGLVGTVLAKDGKDYYAVTELGYMELGNKVGIMIVPGEISPELLWGGVIESDKTWTGKSWDYEPFAKTAKVEKLICFGLANDQIGYILPDNDYRSMFTENEEINAASSQSASTIANSFAKLIADVK